MTRNQLISALQAECWRVGYTPSLVNLERVLSAFSRVLAGSLRSGERLSLPNVGTFSTGEFPAREMREPRGGTMVWVPEKKIVKYRSAKKLKEAINGTARRAPRNVT